MNRHRLQLCGLGLIVTAAWLVAAAPAAAGTLTVDYGNGSASYSAAPGETNQVSIAPIGGGMTVLQDHGVAQVPLSELGGSACVLMEAWKYKCPTAGLTTASADLGDGTDTFDGTSSSLAETVDAGEGSKTIATGHGNDQIFARNGAADQLSCGGGDDTVVADPTDVIASDCEHVDIGDGLTSGGSSTSGTATDGSTASSPGIANPGGQTAQGRAIGLQTPLGLTLPGPALAMPRPHVALVPLACATTAAGGCRGEVVLEQAGDGAAARHAKVFAARGHYLAQQRARRRIGTRRFRLAAGEKTALPVLIKFRGHFTAVEKRRRRRAVLKVVERDPAGKVADVQTRIVTLKLSNKWSRRHR